MKDTIDHSDAESFHSAISNTNKAGRQTTVPEYQPTKKARCRRPSRRHVQDLMSQPDGLTSSEDVGGESTETDRSVSRPCSSRSRHHRPSNPNNPNIPRRQSSFNLERRKRRRYSSQKKDPAALHRQSCQIFSSLDGMLALSREFTPLPSVSTTRTATRHPSLIPEDISGSHFKTDVEERQLCQRVDEKLKVVEREQYNTSYHTRRSISSSPTFRHSYSESSLVYQSHIVTPRMSMSMSVSGDVYYNNNCGGLRRNSMSRNSMAAGAAVQRPPLNTVISWTSNATRREEYEKIDRAHSGIRGFWRKILPKCMHSKNSRRAFYTGGDGDSDSVRRFRVSMDETTDGTDDDDDVVERVVTEKDKRVDDCNDDVVDVVTTLDMDEKGVVSHTSKHCHIAVSTEPATTTTTTTEGKKHRWTCFQ